MLIEAGYAPMALTLHHVPDLLLAILSCWLGLSLLVRAPRDGTARAFAWFCTALSLYGLTGLLPQLTISAEVAQALNRLHLVATAAAPVAFLHFIFVLTSSEPLTGRSWLILGLCYATALILGAYALFGALPAPLPLPWSRWGDLRFPDGPLSWAWTVQRTVPLLLCVALIWRSLRGIAGTVQGRLIRRIFTGSTIVGVIGALLATGARTFATLFNVHGALIWLASPALSRTIILAAMLVLAYAVIAYRALLPPRAAQRTFIYSLIGSLITTIYVGLLLLLEWLVRDWLQIEAPLVTIGALVVMVAVLGPLREWMRDRLDKRFYRQEFDYGRLLRALGDDLFERGSLEDQLDAALAAICRVLGVATGLVAVADAERLLVRALYGFEWPGPELDGVALPAGPQRFEEGWPAWPQAELLLPIRRGDEIQGLLAIGRRRSGQPYTPTEEALLDHLASYLGLAIYHARARDEQQAVITALAEQSAALKARQEELARQATAVAERAEARPTEAVDDDGRLRVYALGPLQVERNGERVTRWGGDKAGTHQAEALFAFLFDRRGRGVSRDEVEELIWADLDIGKADAAFHRTLAGLRRTLEPGLKRGNESRVVLYHHERYWLDPEQIAWCDIDAFEAAAEQGVNRYHQADYEGALSELEQAAQLYRGDYMDDCPFFGDSSYAEERRAPLRERYAEVQELLGAVYDELKRPGEAASAYRRARAASE